MSLSKIVYQLTLMRYVQQHPNCTTSELKRLFKVPAHSPNPRENRLRYMLSYMITHGYILKRKKKKIKYGDTRNQYSLAKLGEDILMTLQNILCSTRSS